MTAIAETQCGLLVPTPMPIQKVGILFGPNLASVVPHLRFPHSVMHWVEFNRTTIPWISQQIRFDPNGRALALLA